MNGAQRPSYDDGPERLAAIKNEISINSVSAGTLSKFGLAALAPRFIYFSCPRSRLAGMGVVVSITFVGYSYDCSSSNPASRSDLISIKT